MNILLGLGAYIVTNAEPLSGIALPILIDFLNKDVKTDRERFFVAATASLFIALFIDRDYILYGSPQQALATWTLLFAESQAVFKLYFKNSGLRYAIQGLYTSQEKVETQATATEIKSMVDKDAGESEIIKN